MRSVESIPMPYCSTLCMPHTNGMEVLRQVRDCQKTCEIPVIIISALATLVNPDRLAKQGVVETLAETL